MVLCTTLVIGIQFKLDYFSLMYMSASMALLQTFSKDYNTTLIHIKFNSKIH